MNDAFSRFARRAAEAVGSPWAFALAVALVIIWLVSGPFFAFSDTWQLLINTATTISTGLIVFLIQHTQNRDTAEMLAELRELVRAIPEADTDIIDEAQE